MTDRTALTFADRATLAAYDELQVPAVCRPWAEQLARSHDDWRGRTVLDLATGSGVVSEVLAPHVGPDGQIVAADTSDEMLDLARRRCAGLPAPVRCVRAAADALDLPDEAVDVVVCQQGLQFFPDRAAAAAEIRRVLRPGGRVVATTWTSLAECDWFQAVHDALVDIGEPDLAARFHVPFDRMPADELRRPFTAANFSDVRVVRRQRVCTFKGGMEQAVATAWSTVAGPDLGRMPDAAQEDFRTALRARLRRLTCDGTAMGRTTVNVMTAAKPA